jgi:hypothetical protein
MPLFTKRRLLKALGVAVLLLGAGLLLLVCTVPSQRLEPMRRENLARALFRVAAFVRVPAYPPAELFLPPRKHRYTMAHTVATCLLAPFIWYAVWLYARRVWRGVAGVRRSADDEDEEIERPDRRRFILATAAVAAPCVVGGGLGAYGVLIEPQRLQVRRYRIGVRDLPRDLEGFRIVHVSDTHYGPFISREYLERVIEEANAQEGDFIILTGDYVHRNPRAIRPGIELLADLRSRLGAAAVLGNHDHWEGAKACRAALERIGIPAIEHSPRFISRDGVSETPKPGESICLTGVGDLWEGTVSFERALKGVPAETPRIVLAHNPDTAEQVPAGSRVDLMCSGHTHGGQVRLPWIGTPMVPSSYGQHYAGGLCRGPRCRVLVSRGVGMAILPVRLGVPPEIGVIELTHERRA